MFKRHIDQHDLRITGRSHRRTPHLDAAGDKDMRVVEFSVTPAEFIHPVGNEVEGEELAVVRMSADKDIRAGRACGPYIGGAVVHHDDRKSVDG